MNSIDKNQPEENYKDVYSLEAGERIKEMAESAKTCFFCTREASGDSLGVRPMSIQKADEDGTLWFLSAKDSHKNQEIIINPDVRLYFQGSPHSDFMYLAGTAEITDDKDIIRELWEPIARAWFTEGENDPRISAIKVTPDTGFYWDNKHGNLIAGSKLIVGAMLGKTMDDSIQGKIKV